MPNFPHDTKMAVSPEAAMVSSVPEAGNSAQAQPKARLVHSLGWMAAASWSTQLISWVCTMTVARSLGPTSFGLIGMANWFLGLAAIVNEFGMSNAIVAMPELSGMQARQLNTISLMVGGGVFAIACLLAYPLGTFFHTPELPPVVMAMSLMFIVYGVRNVPDGLLKREFGFKFLATARGLETLAYGSVIVIATFCGAGYWSLVLGGVIGPTVGCLVVLRYRRVRFAWPRLRQLKPSLLLCWHLLVNRLGGYGYSNMDSLIAGRMLGQAALGSYNLAFNIANLPIQRVSDQVSIVVQSYYSNAQRDEAALRGYVLKITQGLLLLILPVSLGLALVAPQLVLAVFGQRWAASVEPLRILALYIALCSAASVFTPLLIVRGKSRFVMWNNIVATIYLPLGFYCGSRWGTAGIAAAWPLLYPAVALPLFIKAFRDIHLSAGTYLRAVYPAISASLIMVAGVLLAKAFSPSGNSIYVQLGVEVGTGIAVYYLALATLHREHLRSIYGLLRPAVASR